MGLVLVVYAMLGLGVAALAVLLSIARRQLGQALDEIEVLRESGAGSPKLIAEARAKTESIKADAVAQARVTEAEASARAAAMMRSAEADLVRVRDEQATLDAETKRIRAEARAKADQHEREAELVLSTAVKRAEEIEARAQARAQEIGGKAYEALRDASRYEEIARAMRNVVEGYGDRYLVPASSLLDELGEAFAHKEAGSELKRARGRTRAMIRSGQASSCQYVEEQRKARAEGFVLDAFNGKVDSILSRVRHDNFGTLDREIRDAFALVNHGGAAFRDARVTEAYLIARLDELRWAVAAQELRRREQDEQRAAKAKLREEERARKEFERAARAAEKEEDGLKRVIDKARAELEAASASQRAEYEARLAELQARLSEAEERGRRAMSMAQQTKRGHVYVVSNVGSFGESVYKIGLTRRLEPMDRIWELSDASVPFDFDVHAMILSDDAPALEYELHKKFVLRQVNKVNYRKEFFRVTIAELRSEFDALGIEAKWTMTAEAREYRESLAVEKLIDGDDQARDAWVRRQLTLDPTDVPEVVADAPDADGEPEEVGAER